MDAQQPSVPGAPGAALGRREERSRGRARASPRRHVGLATHEPICLVYWPRVLHTHTLCAYPSGYQADGAGGWHRARGCRPQRAPAAMLTRRSARIRPAPSRSSWHEGAEQCTAAPDVVVVQAYRLSGRVSRVRRLSGVEQVDPVESPAPTGRSAHRCRRTYTWSSAHTATSLQTFADASTSLCCALARVPSAGAHAHRRGLDGRRPLLKIARSVVHSHSHFASPADGASAAPGGQASARSRERRLSRHQSDGRATRATAAHTAASGTNEGVLARGAALAPGMPNDERGALGEPPAKGRPHARSQCVPSTTSPRVLRSARGPRARDARAAGAQDKAEGQASTYRQARASSGGRCVSRRRLLAGACCLTGPKDTRRRHTHDSSKRVGQKVGGASSAESGEGAVVAPTQIPGRARPLQLPSSF